MSDIPVQYPIDVYGGYGDDIVIEQDQCPGCCLPYQGDGKAFVYVRPENARALCRAIMACAGEMDDDEPSLPLFEMPAHDRTGAARQRRYRERRKSKSAASQP